MQNIKQEIKKGMKVKTIYGEWGKLIDIDGTTARVEVGCEIRYIHATKVFNSKGKSLAK